MTTATLSSHLRIAMISYHTCPLAAFEGKETGGMNIYVLELSKALASQGHTVDIFTRSQDPSNQRIVQIQPGVRLMHIPAGPEEYLSKKDIVQFIPVFAQHMCDFIEAEGAAYDVAHAHYYQSGLVMRECQSRWSVPLVMTYHTLALMKNLVARTEAEQESSERINVERELANEARQIVILSENEAQYLHYLYDVNVAKITVVPSGFNPHVFHPQDQHVVRQLLDIPRTEKVLMWVGRLEPLKGIDAILFALKILKVRHPEIPIQLWLIGGQTTLTQEMWTREQKKLDALLRQLGLEDVVHFAGQQTQDKLPTYLNAADLVVMPSHYESFGMSALEAMACGIPVITTNVAGISALLDDHHKALVTTVNNPLLLARQIERLLIDVTTYQSIKKYLSEHIQDLSWSTIAVQIATVYRSVL